MKFHTPLRFWSCAGLVFSLSLSLVSTQSEASEPSYDALFSYRYTAQTGFELTEEGVKQALEQFDQLRLDDMWATIAVVGEQNYRSLAPYLLEIYNRSPEQAPDAIVAHFYSDPQFLDVFRTYIVRALARCGDHRAERLGVEQAMKSPNMSTVSSLYAIRNLKYLVKYFETDVSPELEFLISIDPGQDGRNVAPIAARELVEIQKYLQLKSDVRASIYTTAIERRVQDADSSLRREFSRLADSQPSWGESRMMIDPDELDQGGR